MSDTPQNGEQQVDEVIAEAAGLASPFLKSPQAQASLNIAQGLTPAAVHFGFAFAHLMQGWFHHTAGTPSPAQQIASK